jgi:hypothetical protein
MATEAQLPTADEILFRARECLNDAYRALGDAGDWLRSDWKPLGSSLTDAQVRERDRIYKAIETCKNAINRAKS